MLSPKCGADSGGRELREAQAYGAATCRTSPTPHPPTVSHHTEQFVATVVSVDMITREVVLSTPDGRHGTVVAGPESTNLGRLKPGENTRASPLLSSR